MIACGPSLFIVSDEAVASVFRTEAMTTVSAGFHQMTQSYVPEYINCCVHRRGNLKSHTYTHRLTSRNITGKSNSLQVGIE